MIARIRTLNFLPEVFKTPTNSQFLGATLDQIVDQPNTMRIEGYIGSKFGYGINAKDKYVTEPTKTRTEYQLDPGVVFTKTNTALATDFISYPGIVDAINLNNGIANDDDRLFRSQFYSWDPFVDLDKLINYNQYYWLPQGLPAVTISTGIVYTDTNYTVEDLPNGYNISDSRDPLGSTNPVVTLIRGGTYTFSVDQDSPFWIQGQPGVTGFDPVQTNVQTREVLGVTNNGASRGVITFNVPFKDSQDQFNFPGNNLVDLVSTAPFLEVNGKQLSQVKDIDGVTSLQGLTVMFYNTGVVDEQGFIGPFYDTTLYDENGGNPYSPPGTPADDLNYEGGYYTEVSATIYRIEYVGSTQDPVIKLVPETNIPTEEKITVNYGTQYKNKNFYRNTQGVINVYPYLSSILDTLYYQDGVTSNKVGIIKLVESNITNQINVNDILGKKNYTAPNGVVFTNGLKIRFDGNIFPASYKTSEYYVQGVGTSIELLNVAELIVPEPFTEGIYVPYDTLPYDIGNYDITLYIPVRQDYITIARNSIDLNAWSRSNRWFHIDVINNTATYNNDPSIATTYATQQNKANRPIIEFYPNLKLFDHCVQGKNPVNFFDTRTTNAFLDVAGKRNYYPDVEVYTTPTGTLAGVISGTSTTVTIPASSVTGAFQVGQFITDSEDRLPVNAQITSISGTTTLTITVNWSGTETIVGDSNLSFIANDISNDNYKLFDGSRVVFSVDNDPTVRNKIYVARFSDVDGTGPIITLTEDEDGEVLENQGTFAFNGYYNKGKDFHYYFNNDPAVLKLEWQQSQQKTTVNQAPLFDIFDKNGISFGDSILYTGSSFKGNKLFSYGIGSGVPDIVLGFPIRYSAVNNVGDISFDVNLNSDTFTYVSNSNPITQNVNTGYVYNYNTLVDYTRLIGWQTAVADSRQYQVFSFDFVATNPRNTFFLDVAVEENTVWPNIQVYVNNVLQDDSSFTYTVNENSTTVNFNVSNPYENTVIEIAVLSNQVSNIAYYQVPINLSNNPFNEDVTTVNVGDIRGQYQSIFYNNPNITGNVFGSNNYRDLGNVVPWGNKIIQNSASLVLPGTFLRKQDCNLADALQFNSNQYITFKNLLVNTVNNTNYTSYLTPDVMLDDALDQITSSKSESGSFFWSDMLPSKSAYIINSYTFANSLDVSRYALSKIYDFSKANYNGVLVYLTRTVNNFTTFTQLIRDVDYTISTDSPSLTIETDLLPGDIVTIKEYNQTFGSYVPNTPTKLGLYPSFIPGVVLDENYTNPTYFIRGHDGSYNKLYGDYINGQLVDFRDKVLLEFETRIFNNLKISVQPPVHDYDIIPGFFRTTDYSYDEVLSIYTRYFLDWVGQNKIDFKTQVGYSPVDQFSFNYSQSNNKINTAQILQGYWRGIYQYFYDTSQPDVAPWEMLGFADMPSWWTSRYGPAPYTSDNTILWSDLAEGINWNNGNPEVLPQYARPELLTVIPVDDQGNLLSPFTSIIGSYNDRTFRNSWKVGDVSPAEFSYRRSSSWPFDLMKLLSLTEPAKFYNLGVDLDNYKYNEEFNQYLVNDRRHLIISDIEIYGSGTAKTSYINWIVDYQKQVGVDATEHITNILDNLDVRLIYRLAGFSDKALLNFYVEKGTPNSRNASLLIPNESYGVLLYDNVPFTKLVYSGVIVQNTGFSWKVYGNSQNKAYFTINKPKINGNYDLVTVENSRVQVAKDYFENQEIIVPYGTEFFSTQEVAQFLGSYGNYLEKEGMKFDQIESGLDINWLQMVAEFLYWTQSGWGEGSLINLNPSANAVKVEKEGYVVQPLTLQRQNFVLNQNLYPIQSVDLAVMRENITFVAKPLNQGDTVAYGQFNISNIEHGVVFDNVTLFNDVIYNLITGLRQNRIFLRGVKSAEWNGTLDAQGFILNQDNIQEWSTAVKYTKGSIVFYKNKYWTALKVIEPNVQFDATAWKETDYNEIQKGLLPNPSTRSYESTLYYDTYRANLDKDADLLSWSLIGYRPRDYLALADLTDITQINVYQNLIKEKGTRISAESFKGLQLPQGGIDYDVYENWAIKTGEYGGVLNNNFVEFKLNQNELTGNPSLVGLTNSVYIDGVQQQVPLYQVYNYSRPITSPNVLPTIPKTTPNKVYPDAGYVNFNDVSVYGYFYNSLNTAETPLSRLYVGEYIWIADYNNSWKVYTPISLGQIVEVINNFNETVTVVFAEPHNLTKFQPFAIINFNDAVNGYRIVSSVIDPYKVTISLPLVASILRLTGTGIGLRLQLQRVTQPSDISSLPLLNTEFVKNKVWVDTNTDGSWAVYQKSINYQYNMNFTKENSSTFGSAVATTPDLGYLISDSGLGEAYRYTYDPVFNRYNLVQTLVGDSSFGTSISYFDNIFVISQPVGSLITDRKVKLYELVVSNIQNELVELQTIDCPIGVTNWGSSVKISGNGIWIFISAYEQNEVYVYQKSKLDNLYYFSSIITVPGLDPNDKFGFSISTNYLADTLVITAPEIDSAVDNTGSAFVYERLYQNFITQNTSQPFVPQVFDLAFTPSIVSAIATSITSNAIELSLVGLPDLEVGMPVVFTGAVFGGVAENTVYYIHSIIGSAITIAFSRDAVTPYNLTDSSGVMTAVVQNIQLYVSVNGTLLEDNEFAVIGTTINVYSSLNAGDIVNVNSAIFNNIQTFSGTVNVTIGEKYGYSADTNVQGTEVIIGAPYQISNNITEGMVYRYTDGGAKFGYIEGTAECNILTPGTILINGYAVPVPIGNATGVADAINIVRIPNVSAKAVDNKLMIYLIKPNLGIINNKLDIMALTGQLFTELGIEKYQLTQMIADPHAGSKTQFGKLVKFNQNGSFVVSAPVSSRFEATTFDASDDANYSNDTLFDNNSTQFIDEKLNAGAAYIFDYLGNYNESIKNIGKFIYAQSVNDQAQEYGLQPFYATAIDFNNNSIVLGTPNFRPNYDNGSVVIYLNSTGTQNWSVYRESAEIVDVDGIKNAQLYSGSTNNTLINLDYIDPLQGKLLGAVTENLDFISNYDPASYTVDQLSNKGSIVWGSKQVGQLWFNTSTTRFVNYHQNNDVVYNSKWWGRVFPGSDVSVYTWITSNVLPINYTGPGTPYSFENYAVEYVLNATGAIVPVYFYWVRNTNIIFNQIGKTLSDTICESYITIPQATGISYFSPILPSVFGLYNSGEYINGFDTVMHLGFATSKNDDNSHSIYSLIRANYADDFLPGLPGTLGIKTPESLYNHLLESLSGCALTGEIVPDPYLPKTVQSGILARPRQSFFYNRFGALKNYLTFANEFLKEFPASEISDPLFLFKQGEINPSTGQPFYDTQNYWEYINWWAPGYSNSTRPALLVESYYELAEVNAQNGLIVTVNKNGAGLQETYVYNSTTGIWDRVGLQNGTIQFKSSLWDYETARLGFGDNFFDTTPFDEYPSEETRYIVRALNEQLPAQYDLFRNKALILLFNYIVSETIESQNYMPWLNKTSFIDVLHTIRELLPLNVFESDNQDFLAGYINEVKPYHVVIKDFLFKYTGSELYGLTATDFDLPSTYNATYKQYISPELVNTVPLNEYQYSPSDTIWQSEAYTEWFNNFGVTISGVDNYQITTLVSYVDLAVISIVVDNAFGFPINGVITIGNEQIAYSNVDRAYSTLNGLTRGVNGTPIENHLPGEKIFINLPAVLVLDGGRGYIEPPTITPYIDLTKYPAPRRAAILQPVMNLDSILRIDVIDPGEGYQVLPEILIQPSSVVTFSSDNVVIESNTIVIQNQLVQTGDLVQYFVEEDTTPIGGLKIGQYYYVAVLQSVPEYVIALYTTYADALHDKNRVELLSSGVGEYNKLAVSARASCVATAAPIRENSVNLRFDRTTYTSKIKEWTPGTFYGSFYAGMFKNSEDIASSSISLYSSNPPISSVFASNAGAVFEIQDIKNNQVINWSSRTRDVLSTLDVTGNPDLITIAPSEGGAPLEGEIGPTTGFYIGMPIKFLGAAFGGISTNYVYYVSSIVGLTQFSIVDELGTPIDLYTDTVPAAGLSAIIGQPTNTGVVTIQYPGILTVTNTEKTTNFITIPLLDSGLGGTTGLYTGLPVYFTGNVFGDVIENEIYYINTVVDNQTLTISTESNPVTTSIIQTEILGNLVKLSSLEGLDINTPIIVTQMTIGGVSTNDFGGVLSGVLYYIASLDYVTNKVTLSTAINEVPITITSDVSPASDTTGTVTSQEYAVQLATSSGNMTVTVGMPASPGQITGQQFTFYNTSKEFTNGSLGYSGSYSNLIERKIIATVASDDYIYLDISTNGVEHMYVNMPFRVASTIGGLTSSTTYYVKSIGNIDVEITSSSSSTNEYTCVNTTGFYSGMPVYFTNGIFGGVQALVTYFVKTVTSGTTFTISDTASGPTKTLFTSNGSMNIVGVNPFIIASASIGGSAVSLTSTTLENDLTQYITSTPTFFVSYKLGGYSVVINSAGSGFAYNNNITISGTNFGGTSPRNDVIVNIDDIGINGEITSTIVSGTPSGAVEKYYLKVISENELEVYADPLMTVPVNGNDLLTQFDPVKTTTVTEIDNGTGYITVEDSSEFVVNDQVVFTGNVVGNIVLGTRYYVIDIPSANVITISETIEGTIFYPGTESGVSFTMAKPGDYAYLPEPFFFDQSFVKYNNRIYQCVISNNDDEFIIGKWEIVDSGDRRINAMDRVVGYYQPTINMPGSDLTQLFNGVTYPNAVYQDNPFPPAEEFIYDVNLTDEPFYPTGINNVSILWDGIRYVGAINSPEYSAAIMSYEGLIWTVNKLANIPLSVNNLNYLNNLYIITANNNATPLYTSTDGIEFKTSGALTVESNSLNAVDYNDGNWIAVGENIVKSSNSTLWLEVYELSYPGELTDIKYVNIPSYIGWLAIGNWTVGSTDRAVLLNSDDGDIWTEINSGVTTIITGATLNALTVGNDLIVFVADNGRIFTSTNPVSYTEQNSGVSTNLNSIAYIDGLYIVAGDNGTILTSTDAVTWNINVSGTTVNLNSVTSNTIGTYIIAGDDNVILTSTTAGTNKTWTQSATYSQTAPVYTVQGDSFDYGYGPEELVPGVVTDNLTMVINTRPGTNWSTGEYGHTGFNVESILLSPTELFQTEYSFANIVENPVFITVFEINSISGLGTRIYNFAIDWINKKITLDSPISFANSLQLSIYEVGNGDQLEKSNSQTNPFINNVNTGFTEILLETNYSASRFNGSGLIRLGTQPKQVTCVATESSTNSIICDDVSAFVLNSPIKFQGGVFGGLTEDQIYYVKTISYVTNKITVSLPPLVSGIAGPTFEPSDGSGSMEAILQTGTGLVWADPLVSNNGNALVLGETSTVTQTRSSTNSIVVNTALTMDVGDSIVFANNIFGGITPQYQYNVLSIIDDNEFTIEDPANPGIAVTLTNATGISTCVTNDYAIALQDTGIKSKLVFANVYDKNADYVTFVLFGETEPVQYGYSIPETESFVVTSNETVFSLTNYLGGNNSENAVVERNGLRLTLGVDYTIDPFTDELTLNFSTVNNDIISVTTYNDTQRQYLYTNYFAPVTETVASIVAVNNNIIPNSTVVSCSATNNVTNEITCASTDGLVANQVVLFKGISFDASILIDGTAYFIDTVTSATTFTIKDQYGTVIALSGGSGPSTLLAFVGGQPAIAVTTATPHLLSENDLIRLDGLNGAVQLNNQQFYAKVITDYTVWLYFSPYDPALNATNNPAVTCSLYTGNGYMWKDGIFTLNVALATDTDATDNTILLDNVDNVFIDTPIYFSGNVFGNIVAGTKYYVRTINSLTNKITISETYLGDEFMLTTATGNMGVAMWEQSNTDRIWVTINGHRVPANKLVLNPNNNLSILHGIDAADTVIITHMIPTATPNSLTYIQNVNKSGVPSVYRVDSAAQTWLTQPLTTTDTTIYVDSISKITTSLIQNVVVSSPIDGVYSVGLLGDKNTISQVIVVNETTNLPLPENFYTLVIENSAPTIVFSAGVNTGDNLTIKIIMGNLIYVAGEQIYFRKVDFVTNSVTELTRGANGTGVQTYIAEYETVYGLLSANKLPDINYPLTWNSYEFNPIIGDPLQISTTNAANFLNTDGN